MIGKGIFLLALTSSILYSTSSSYISITSNRFEESITPLIKLPSKEQNTTPKPEAKDDSLGSEKKQNPKDEVSVIEDKKNETKPIDVDVDKVKEKIKIGESKTEEIKEPLAEFIQKPKVVDSIKPVVTPTPKPSVKAPTKKPVTTKSPRQIPNRIGGYRRSGGMSSRSWGPTIRRGSGPKRVIADYASWVSGY